MAALTRNTPRTRIGLGQRFADPVAAAVTIYSGAMVALDASGNAIPAIPAAPTMRGVALEEADNADGAAGDVTTLIERGAFLVANGGSIDRTHIGGDVYVADDNTVAATGTLVAGKCLDVTSAGVVVEIL
ncbi:hypothetical protein RGUI_0836 [Rhodovulum sp. P5]|uniref:virion structural protein n=1 Tax=Rhodovulum phage vB_RhkS_P1 TaxID=1873452 RepID=UPI00080AA171|nr:hypothetical protein [Rhodovulum sp. P5]YP_009285923.1 virion structural protein [Rhodovulum phage vB_RhkS_P1]ANT39909.1 hypothetical protein Rhks_38 [Rhodovulum phage vB_RhkS_P1]ARE38977.1 hypothetical protein RGUI_0836 [Rhodovulum sp. P5]